jgi:hypothetical protein
MTSESVYSDDARHAVRNVADLTSHYCFWSNGEPGQGGCWDFREMRIRPTHYTIASKSLQSWVLESSLDSQTWTEIDRKTDSTELPHFPFVASFPLANSAEGCFIRLTQTGKYYWGKDVLNISNFEVFGAIVG